MVLVLVLLLFYSQFPVLFSVLLLANGNKTLRLKAATTTEKTDGGPPLRGHGFLLLVSPMVGASALLA